jgi:hypothetical protein
VVETESVRERDHADVRAHPDTARAETNTREIHIRRAATTESAREKTDTLEDVEVVANGTEETVALTDEETVAMIRAVVESAPIVAAICSTTAEEAVEEVAIVPLSNPSTRSAAPALQESPRSPLPT